MNTICEEIIANYGIEIPKSLTTELTDSNFLYAILCLNHSKYCHNDKHKAAEIIRNICESNKIIDPSPFDKLKDDNGNTLIHYLHFHSYEYCVQYMINAGLNINDLNNNGNTPLHTNGNAAIIDILLYNKANIHIKNDNGLTCEQIQEKNKRYKSVKKIKRTQRCNTGLINVRGADNSSVRAFKKVFKEIFCKSYCHRCRSDAYLNLVTGGFYCDEDFMSLYNMWEKDNNCFYKDHSYGDPYTDY